MPEEIEKSPQFTIQMHEGVHDELKAMLDRVRTTSAKASDSMNASQKAQDAYFQQRDAVPLLEEKYAALLAANEQAINLLHSLIGSLMAPAREPRIDWFVDGPESLYWRYPSGYSGGMILHERQYGPRARWGIHT